MSIMRLRGILKLCLSGTCILGILSVGLFSGVPAVHAATCAVTTTSTIDQTYIDSNACSTINISGTITVTWSGTTDLVGAGDVNITSGTVTFSGAVVLGSTDTMSISSGAVVTHAQGNTTGVNISASALTVAGTINTNGKGCTASAGPNTSTGICAATTSGYGITTSDNGSGAGHGGAGGRATSASTGATYDTNTGPTLLGSGGGSGNGNSTGGTGGGIIRLGISGTLTVNGAISANGANGLNDSYWAGGGGSGGSVYITAGTLAGSSTITAGGGNGGDGTTLDGGGGGGGRVAIYYDALSGYTLANTVTSNGIKGGTGQGSGADGSTGSTFILDRKIDDGAGTLTITSGLDFTSAGDFARTNISISSGASLTCATFATLNLTATSTLTMSGVTWACSTVDTINITAGTWTTSGTNTLTWNKAGGAVNWNITNDLTLNNTTITGYTSGLTATAGGGITMTNAINVSLVSTAINSNLSWTSLASLNIDSGSSIRANGTGCGAGRGPNTSTGICATTTSGYGLTTEDSGSGAGHGGAGGRASNAFTGATYDTNTGPTLLGSGGGSGRNGATGGTGGGIIRLGISGTLTVNGAISANGTNGLNDSFWAGGGGSGGSVYITAGTLAGSSTVTASGGNGGDGTSLDGGGGGGGRVAIYYAADSSSYLQGMTAANTSVKGIMGGTGQGSGADGADGTLYTLQYTIPVTPSITAPAASATAQSRNPALTSNAYSSNGAAHSSSDWKISTDSGGSTIVWSKTSDATNLTSITVNTTNGTFAGALSGLTKLASNTTYYVFVRHNNGAGSSSWSTASSFSTINTGITITESSGTAVTEGGATDSYTVVLTSLPTASVVVTVSVDSQVTVSSGTLTFTTGNWSTPQTVTVTAVNDAIAEGSHSGTITHTAASADGNYDGATIASVSATIADNDTAGITVVESASSTGVKEGDYTDTYTIVLGSQPTASVVVTITSTTSEATPAPSPLTFTTVNWATPQTVTVTAVNDTDVESSQSDTLTHSVTSVDSLYSGFSVASVSVAIVDNDHRSSGGVSDSFSTTAKTINVVAPVTGTQVLGGGTINVSWNYTGAIPNATVSLSTDAGSTWTVMKLNILNTGSTSFAAPSGATTSALVKVEGTDLVTSLAADESVPFTITAASSTVTAPPDDTASQEDSSSLPSGISIHNLIKLANDGDANTQVDSAVYYVGADLMRHAFPNSSVYFTWYSNFGGVEVVSTSDLAALTLGPNVTYKPGVKMVKFESSPKVYVVDRLGVLRWVASEEAAIELYGSTWNTNIDVISDAFFAGYSFGTEVEGIDDFDPNGFSDITNPSDSMPT